MKILIIDDDRDDRGIVKSAIHAYDSSIDVFTAASPEEGFEVATTIHPDLIFLDHYFPGSILGLGVFEQIRKWNPDCPIIVFTGESDFSARQVYIENGAVEFVTKDMISISTIPLILHNAMDKAEVSRLLRVEKEINQRVYQQLAHDIRSPLINITFLAEMLSEEMNLSNERVERIHELSKNATEMFDKIVMFLKDSNEFNLVLKSDMTLDRFLNRLCDDFRHHAEKKKVVFEQFINHTSGDIPFDFAGLSIVLNNLLVNALKFTPQGGYIKVCGSEGKDGYVIEVVDSGRGIEEGRISELFNSSVNSSTSGIRGEAGYGLGLPFSYQIVKAHGSILEVESSNKGSRFYFKLKSQQSKAA